MVQTFDFGITRNPGFHCNIALTGTGVNEEAALRSALVGQTIGYWLSGCGYESAVKECGDITRIYSQGGKSYFDIDVRLAHGDDSIFINTTVQRLS